jgi:hypothetical protein
MPCPAHPPWLDHSNYVGVQKCEWKILICNVRLQLKWISYKYKSLKCVWFHIFPPYTDTHTHTQIIIELIEIISAVVLVASSVNPAGRWICQQQFLCRQLSSF